MHIYTVCELYIVGHMSKVFDIYCLFMLIDFCRIDGCLNDVDMLVTTANTWVVGAFAKTNAASLQCATAVFVSDRVCTCRGMQYISVYQVRLNVRDDVHKVWHQLTDTIDVWVNVGTDHCVGPKSDLVVSWSP